VVLYFKGDANLNPQKAISIVGSRKATVKGKQFCEKLIEELAVHQATIISGMAFGVDICAHQAAIEMGLPTLAVMGMPLNTLYPPQHRKYAERMLENGGWVSDYHSNAPMIPSNFAERNRIVAGMSDATIVIESGKKGGSMITAGLAVDYNRDVFAVPGRPDDELSEGCNHLIKSQQAALIDSAKDIEYVLNWEKQKKGSVNQTALFQELDPEEKELIGIFANREPKPIDEISVEAGIPMSKTATILLALELKGVVLSLPGKMYQLN
jgi:DNA processing protein